MFNLQFAKRKAHHILCCRNTSPFEQLNKQFANHRE